MMSFTEAVTTCLKKFVTFSGRAPRAEYWYFTLFTAILSFVGAGLDTLFFGRDFWDGGGIFESAVTYGFFLPGLAVMWRRLHDIGKPGWYALILFVGVIVCAFLLISVVAVGIIGILVGIGFYFYWMCKPSDPGMNKYGPNPYDDPGQDLAEVFE